MQREPMFAAAAQQQLHDYATFAHYGALLPARFDPRWRHFMREVSKPSQSYIGLIAMAILSAPEQRRVLSDIYQWMLDHYAYFRLRGPGWRNSIRHNLSLNDCFVKADRSANGKGHYWSIHPANLADFSNGDFRRRRAQRRVRKSLGLSTPDDEDLSTSSEPEHGHRDFGCWPLVDVARFESRGTVVALSANKRRFDVDSLLAPDRPIHVDVSKSDGSSDTDTLN